MEGFNFGISGKYFGLNSFKRRSFEWTRLGA